MQGLFNPEFCVLMIAATGPNPARPSCGASAQLEQYLELSANSLTLKHLAPTSHLYRGRGRAYPCSPRLPSPQAGEGGRVGERLQLVVNVIAFPL